MRTRIALPSLILVGLISTSAVASEAPGKHPYYLHALSDLREAYSLIQHRPGDLAANGRESVALNEITDAIKDIRQGAVDDGRDLDDHTKADAASDHSGALHEAANLLNKARDDVAKEEDDQAAKGLQQRSLQHIDRAHKAVEDAIADVQSKH